MKRWARPVPGRVASSVKCAGVLGALLLCNAAVYGESMTEAVRRGDLSAVKKLVGGGADVNKTDDDGFTPLLRAAFDGQVEVARYLISRGADVNVRLSVAVTALNREGIEIGDERTAVIATPLVAAAFRGHLPMVELLVEGGADINLEAADETPPLTAALNAGQEEIAQFLLTQGADLDAVRLGDPDGAKQLPGILFVDLPEQEECRWEAPQREAAANVAVAFPASGQLTSYAAPTRASGGVPVAVADDGAIRAGAALRFVDNGNGTVTDLNTGLMWEKKCGGGGGLHDYRRVYRWADPSPEQTIWGWIAAVNAERGTGFAGYDDWRVPNVKELQSLIDYGRVAPAVDIALGVEDCRGCMNLREPQCSCTAPSFHWSGTTFSDFIAHAVVVGFGSGFIDDAVKSQRLFVRAVRGGR